MKRTLLRLPKRWYKPYISPLNRRLIIQGSTLSTSFPITDFSLCYSPNKLFISKQKLPLILSSINRAVSNIKFGSSMIVKAEGVGIKFKRYSRKSNLIALRLGYAHTILYQFSKLIRIRLAKHKVLMFSSKPSLLYEVASQIRGYRPPDAYKGRGLKYHDERLKLKPGKQRLR
jgi:hypothetical protein